MNQENRRSRSLFEEPTATASSEQHVSPKRPLAPWKVALIVGLALVVGVVFALKHTGANPPGAGSAATAGPSPDQALPRFIEIGSATCIPCKMMAPILDELRREYPGRLQVDFIDVNREPEAARSFLMRVIPTQVFLDAPGKEVFRHEGFFPKKDILAKWKKLGIDLDSTSTSDKGKAPDMSQSRLKGVS